MLSLSVNKVVHFFKMPKNKDGFVYNFYKIYMNYYCNK